MVTVHKEYFTLNLISKSTGKLRIINWNESYKPSQEVESQLIYQILVTLKISNVASSHEFISSDFNET